MSSGLKIYLTLWIAAVGFSTFIALKRRKEFLIFHRSYGRFITERWKVVTFVIATSLVAIAAPFSGDATWDILNSLIISFVTYYFAPWSIAMLYQSLRSKRLKVRSLVAVIYIFTPCWTYDVYILIRDGFYPPTWLHNIPITFGITVLAGLFWNLYHSENAGLTFAFKFDNWPSLAATRFRDVFWPCVFLSIPVMASIFWFVYQEILK